MDLADECGSAVSFPQGSEGASGAVGVDAAVAGGVIDRLVAEGKAAALSPNTRRAYRTGWRSWARWAAEQGVSALPAAPGDLQRWLAALRAERKKPTTLGAYLAAVAHRHRGSAGPNPAHCAEVRDLMVGLRRRAAADGYEPQQAAPLRQHHLEAIASSAHRPRNTQPGGRPETRRQARERARVDVAMVGLAHDALLRCSELLELRWGDIDLPAGGGCGTARIRRSKTDQSGRGAAAPVSETTCKALARMKPKKATSRDRIFDFSANTVTRRFKAAARAAGINPQNISSHSPRVGMAQDLAASGVDIAGIMLAGRWQTSRIAARYTRNLAAHHTPAAQFLTTRHRTHDARAPKARTKTARQRRNGSKHHSPNSAAAPSPPDNPGRRPQPRNGNRRSPP